MFALAVIGVLASVVSAFYYLNIVKIMYFDEPAEGFEPIPGEIKLVIGAAGIFVVGFIVFAKPVVTLAQAAAASLF